MRTMMLIMFTVTVFSGGNMFASDYEVLQINLKSITSNGLIDFKNWKNQNFPRYEPISVGNGKNRVEYERIGDLFFDVSTQNRIDELSRRLKACGVRDELQSKCGYLHYKGKKLKYSKKVIEGPEMWGSTVTGESERGFRFGRYLIFLVQVRAALKENPFDFVVYDLSNDTFSIYKTFSAWPQVWIFKKSEGIVDPTKVVN